MYHLHVTSARFRTETQRSFHLIKNIYISKAMSDETAHIQALIQNSVCGAMMSQKVEQSAKNKLGKSL